MHSVMTFLRHLSYFWDNDAPHVLGTTDLLVYVTDIYYRLARSQDIHEAGIQLEAEAQPRRLI